MFSPFFFFFLSICSYDLGFGIPTVQPKPGISAGPILSSLRLFSGDKNSLDLA